MTARKSRKRERLTLIEPLEQRCLLSASVSDALTTPLSLHWTQVANSPVPRLEASAITVGNRLYVFGGYGVDKPSWLATKETDAYNPATNKWTRLADMPEGLTHIGVATDGRYIYAAGGYVSNYSTGEQSFATRDAWRYDTFTNKWTAFVPLPAARSAGAMVIIGNQLHYVDGNDINRNGTTEHWVLNLSAASPRWVSSTPLPFSRNHIAAAVLNGKIYVIGGQAGNDDGAPDSDVLMWDPSHPSAWQRVASLPQARSHAVAVAVDGQILLIDGVASWQIPLASVIAYNPSTNKWSSVSNSMPSPRENPAGDIVAGKLVITTGYYKGLRTGTWESPVPATSAMTAASVITPAGVIASTARAFVSITPGPTNLGIDASTWTPKSFTITNNSASGQNIENVVVDISSSLLPDLIFTPTTAGGDDVPKDLTADSDPTVVGLTTHSYSQPLDGGYQQLEIDFDNFGPGKTFLFSLDIDPADIKGAHSPGPSGSGGISGLELTGSHWTFSFDDGSSVTADIYRTPGSVSGGQNIIEAGGPPQPSVQLLNVPTTPVVLNNASQTVRVSGPAGAHVQLMVDDTGQYLSGVPGGGFDLHPFESNRVVKITEFSATVGAGGFVDIPIKLMKSDSNAGFNHIVAVFKDADGRTGPVSQNLVVQYVPPTLSVTALELVNADTGKVITGYANVTNGQTINLATLPTKHLTLVATTSGGVKSVKFGLDSNSSYHIANLAPFSIAGIWNGKYNYWKPPLGKHTIAVTPYAGSSATGTVGLPLKLTINFVNS